MDGSILEGTEVLEKLAEIELIDEFWETIDRDDFELANQLMIRVKIDDSTRKIILDKMRYPDSEH